MKITKENYNELKSKDLENNYAKVWHVNEIREELLANTPEPLAYEKLVLKVLITSSDPTVTTFENTFTNNNLTQVGSNPLQLTFDNPFDVTKLWGIVQGGNSVDPYRLLVIYEGGNSILIMDGGTGSPTDGDVYYIELRIYL